MDGGVLIGGGIVTGGVVTGGAAPLSPKKAMTKTDYQWGDFSRTSSHGIDKP